jgi:hypothetical protein
MVVFDATCDIFEISIQELEGYSYHRCTVGKELQLLFQLMTENFKARIQHISVDLNTYWSISSKYLANTLWNPQFLALSTFDKRLRPSLGVGRFLRYTLKACGVVDATHKRFWEGRDQRWRTVCPQTVIEKQNLAEKRRLQSLVQK